MHETTGLRDFAWQVEATVAYIAGQEEHHRKRDFQTEFVAFLKKHGIEY